MNAANAQTQDVRPEFTGEVQRPLRADAQRNRDRIIEVARAMFAESGDAVALESIAKDAGVGIGTLYRNFASREALLEAVYAVELEKVTTNAADLLSRLDPESALRAWMGRYADFIAAKRGILPALSAGAAPGRRSTTRARVTAAIDTIVVAGVQSGAFRADVIAVDITALTQGAFIATSRDDGPERIARLLNLIVDALLVNPGRTRAS
ncbi:TetR/AcrR family transcriptional regulator [Subtercola lobariae]|uniref:TetR family transcriptional regulator n=1 Tax=Subtercola lobariae TaxID=1588641 RepID=A0A917EWT2_9MICO|nr:TetR/AcrR family transcriptional regulator [Subtercola lobariae]GGF16520.1 TetR family transcriptional regulator [Subtercola lobariae]